MCCMRIECIVNSAVLIHCGEEKILVDGIFGKTAYFSSLPADIKKACFGMGEKYRDIDYLLFTHRHEDHFYSGMVNAYVRNNRVRIVAVPEKSSDPGSMMEDREGIACAQAGGILCEIEDRQETIVPGASGNVSLRAVRCRHLDPASFGNIRHYAFLIEGYGKKLLIAADADASEQNAEAFSSIKEPDAVLVTPLFFLNPAGRAILRKMQPKQTLIYHLPYQKDDITGVRELAENLAAEHAEDNTLKLFDAGSSEII